MSLPGSGCCCGIIVGMFFAVLLAVTGTVAVYCWMNPEARRSGVSSVEKAWTEFKAYGDKWIVRAKDTDAKIPEPEIKIKID